MAAGDAAFVQVGTYRETVHPKSGQRFEAESGAKPLISGCDPVGGWTLYAGHICNAPVSSKVYDVFVGTNYMHKARWPHEDDPMTMACRRTSRPAHGFTASSSPTRAM